MHLRVPILGRDHLQAIDAVIKIYKGIFLSKDFNTKLSTNQNCDVFELVDCVFKIDHELGMLPFLVNGAMEQAIGSADGRGQLMLFESEYKELVKILSTDLQFNGRSIYDFLKNSDYVNLIKEALYLVENSAFQRVGGPGEPTTLSGTPTTLLN